MVSGADDSVDVRIADALDRSMDLIGGIQSQARGGKRVMKPRWPMIVLRTPKGWTGPKEVDGKKVEGSFRAHQVPASAIDQPGPPRDRRGMAQVVQARGAVRARP